MATLLADPERVLLSDPLAGLSLASLPSLEAISAPAPSLNGKQRAGGNADFDWMEPTPGVKPTAYTRVQIEIVNQRGGASLAMPAQVFKLPEGDLLRCVYYTLTIGFGITPEHIVTRWWLEPGGDDATLRTDALDLLQALHRRGTATIREVDSGKVIGHTKLEGVPFDPELVGAREFLERIAILEEWSGRRIPVPKDVGADVATEIARAEAIVLARQIPVRVGRELSVTVAGEPALGIDELRLPRTFDVTLLGVDVPLGSAVLSVAVQVVSATQLESGLARINCELASDQPEQLLVHLEPPPTRSRILRRTLVAGAPIPPHLDVLAARTDLRRLAIAEQLLADLDREHGPIPAEVLAEIEAQWPE